MKKRRGAMAKTTTPVGKAGSVYGAARPPAETPQRRAGNTRACNGHVEGPGAIKVVPDDELHTSSAQIQL
jgi:hypothetical protein